MFSHLPCESQTTTSVPSSGPRRVQAASSWAFCLQGHQVGLSVGVVGSHPRQYFSIKASLHLSQELILFLGKDCSHSLALPLKEKGKSFSLTMSPSTSLYFCMSQSSIKSFKCKAASSPVPEN